MWTVGLILVYPQTTVALRKIFRSLQIGVISNVTFCKCYNGRRRLALLHMKEWCVNAKVDALKRDLQISGQAYFQYAERKRWTFVLPRPQNSEVVQLPNIMYASVLKARRQVAAYAVSSVLPELLRHFEPAEKIDEWAVLMVGVEATVMANLAALLLQEEEENASLAPLTPPLTPPLPAFAPLQEFAPLPDFKPLQPLIYWSPYVYYGYVY